MTLQYAMTMARRVRVSWKEGLEEDGRGGGEGDEEEEEEEDGNAMAASDMSEEEGTRESNGKVVSWMLASRWMAVDLLQHGSLRPRPDRSTGSAYHHPLTALLPLSCFCLLAR